MSFDPDAPIFLIGYRATGKSTIGPLLAERLGFDCVDSDVEIERRTGKSIAELFDQGGEEAFRNIESEVVADLCQSQQLVVALGGGAVLRRSNRDRVKTAGRVVLLTASVDTICARLVGDASTASRRPNLTKIGGRAEIEILLNTRTPIYRECATFEIDTEGKPIDEIVEEILYRLAETSKLRGR